MSKLTLILPIALFSLAALSARQTQTPPEAAPPSYAPIPAEAAKQINPVKSSHSARLNRSSLQIFQKQWNLGHRAGLLCWERR